MEKDHAKQTDLQLLEKDNKNTYVTLNKDDLENILLNDKSESFIEQAYSRLDKKVETVSIERIDITENLRLIDLSLPLKEKQEYGWNMDKIHAVIAITLSGVLSVLLIGMAITYFL